MDGNRFDDVIRSLVASPSRRTVMGLTLGGALGSLLGLSDLEAKKKKRKGKKKKKCKGNKKKCGKKCIPKTNCCTDANCGSGGATCQNGTCLCPTGQKDCQGTCIPNDDCCPACTGGKTCDGGECVCQAGAFPCGDDCVPGDQCCTTSDCASDFTCEDGFCICDGIVCDSECCDPAEDEVCNFDFFGSSVCQSGGCPETDYCIGPETFLCTAGGCVCTTTVDATPENACVEEPELSVPDCTTCASSADCGTGEVCIASGQFCGEDCGAAFCVPLCGEGVLRSAGRGGSPSLKGVSASQGSKGKRRHHTQRSHKRGGRKRRR